jgi:hypothetical protein
MSDLAAFYAARLDEDEAAAKAAAGPEWLEDGSPSLAVFARQWSEGDRPGVRGIAWCSNGYDDDRANMAHIARHDPARVLREVGAGRAILELHKPDRDPADQWYGHDVRCEECGGITGSAASGERGFQRSWPCTTLRHLAAVHNAHADYQQEWKP